MGVSSGHSTRMFRTSTNAVAYRIPSPAKEQHLVTAHPVADVVEGVESGACGNRRHEPERGLHDRQDVASEEQGLEEADGDGHDEERDPGLGGREVHLRQRQHRLKGGEHDAQEHCLAQALATEPERGHRAMPDSGNVDDGAPDAQEKAPGEGQEQTGDVVGPEHCERQPEQPHDEGVEAEHSGDVDQMGGREAKPDHGVTEPARRERQAQAEGADGQGVDRTWQNLEEEERNDEIAECQGG